MYGRPIEKVKNEIVRRDSFGNLIFFGIALAVGWLVYRMTEWGFIPVLMAFPAAGAAGQLSTLLGGYALLGMRHLILLGFWAAASWFVVLTVADGTVITVLGFAQAGFASLMLGHWLLLLLGLISKRT